MKPPFRRPRAFLTYLCLLVALPTMPGAMTTRTFTYKTVGHLEIKADVIRPDDDTVRPILVWIHGGALMNGSRQSVPDRVKDPFLSAGYAIVSIDYRLAPETKLPGIIEDLKDAIKWIRDKGPDLFLVDASKIAVAGGSAGGCLTLTSGFRVQPPPTVLVSFWGYGDLIGDWYSTPSHHPRHNQKPLTWEDVKSIPDGPPVANGNDREGNGGLFYQYCRQTGQWPKQVSEWDPRSEAERFFPYMAVKNVSSDYPPTLLIHGTEDTDVPYEQSVLMADQFKLHGVPHRLISIENGEHGLGGGDPEAINQAYAAVLPFVQKYMQD
ncbi:MAG: alpha/beta hydrolase [Verrucomicrobiae bacterium]|nr:alpha/beta hydrolase [Verrucomicrobiae bacterium]